MTYYLVAQEMNAVAAWSSTGVGVPSDNGGIAITDVRGSIFIPGNSAGNGVTTAHFKLIDAATDLPFTSGNGLSSFWTAIVTQQGNMGSSGNVYQWLDTAGTPWFRIIVPSQNVYQAQYWNGTTWTNMGSTFVVNLGSVHRFDLNIVIASSGKFIVFLDNVLVFEFDADFSAIPPISELWWSGSNQNSDASFSRNILVADTSTRECTIRTKTASAAGAKQEWVGAFGNINEFPETSTLIVSTPTAAKTTNYAHAAFSATPSGQEVKAVAVGSYMRRDTSGPQNAKLLLTIGGTDYAKDVATPDISYTGRCAIWNADPSTVAAWNGVTNVNAASFGAVSET